MMIIFLPAKVVRGAMEPDIVKSADGYKSDIKALAQIPSYRSTLIGVTCSNMITGAATVFFPEFVSIAAVITGNVDPCVQPPCEYTNIVFRFGLITILAGFGGAVFGIYATKLGHSRNNHLIEAELCGFGCMLAAISVYIVTVFCKFFLLHTCNYFFFNFSRLLTDDDMDIFVFLYLWSINQLGFVGRTRDKSNFASMSQYCQSIISLTCSFTWRRPCTTHYWSAC